MKLKLIWLLIFCIYEINSELTATNVGKLEKNTPKIIKLMKKCVYVDLDEFSGSSLKVKVTVKNGYFDENIMYWGGYNDLPVDGDKYQLKVYEDYDSEEKGNNSTTLYFYITPSSLFDYVFLAIPEFSNGEVEIEWDSHGLSVGALIGIVIAIIFVILIIIFLYIKKRRLASVKPLMAPPVQPTYIPPVEPYYSQDIAPN